MGLLEVQSRAITGGVLEAVNHPAENSAVAGVGGSGEYSADAGHGIEECERASIVEAELVAVASSSGRLCEA